MRTDSDDITDAGARSSAVQPPRLSALDIACGMPLGCAGAPAMIAPAASLRDVCAHIFEPILREGPVWMPFSGGVESAIWLAAATRHARARGYADPIPLTLCHPGLQTASHARVQERIVARLGLADWKRVASDESLDLVGPLAAATLAAGPLWPPHAYVMAPLMRAAEGGAFVIMTGLSDFFAWWRWAPLASVGRGHRPHRADLALLARALAPASLRVRAAARRQLPPPMGWLTPAAQREAMMRLRRRLADVPLRGDRAVALQATHRCFAASAQTLGAIGELAGVRVEQPLSRPGVMGMLAGAAGRRGFAGLEAMREALCGELLPTAVLTASPPIDLGPTFFADASREFAERFDGTGLDPSIVDVAVLRRIWLGDRPDPRTACLLQHAWLAQPATAGDLVPTP